MGKSIEANIQCPFYVREKDDFIVCEGVIPNTTATHTFSGVRAKSKWEKEICCINGGRNCIYYNAVNQKYE